MDERVCLEDEILLRFHWRGGLYIGSNQDQIDGGDARTEHISSGSQSSVGISLIQLCRHHWM